MSRELREFYDMAYSADAHPLMRALGYQYGVNSTETGEAILLSAVKVLLSQCEEMQHQLEQRYLREPMPPIEIKEGSFLIDNAVNVEREACIKAVELAHIEGDGPADWYYGQDAAIRAAVQAIKARGKK